MTGFQSTHSLRSATYAARRAFNIADVSIHALLAECDPYSFVPSPVPRSFNPRTPCGVRLSLAAPLVLMTQFQSTHSLRSATFFVHRYYLTPAVSIHALLAECDGQPRTTNHQQKGFNPRTPCGVRRMRYKGLRAYRLFQSTHSLRSATCNHATGTYPYEVSIHALLAECDLVMVSAYRTRDSFNPRTPCGVRLQDNRYLLSGGHVSIHALLAECDGIKSACVMSYPCFNPRTPCGVRHLLK